MTTTPEPTMLTIFDDRQCLGFVLRRGPKGFEVFDAYGVSFGLFPTKGEAVGALMTLGVKGDAQ